MASSGKHPQDIEILETVVAQCIESELNSLLDIPVRNERHMNSGAKAGFL